MKKMFAAVLCVALMWSVSCPALAQAGPTEVESAGAYLRDHGIYQGNGSGDLMLDKGLTRVELATVLTRLHGEGQVEPEYYTWACYFTDVPGWATGCVGYCVASLLMNGYDSQHFGPYDMVSPAMACTVVLRCCGYAEGEGSAWTYHTAAGYAVQLGLLDQSAAQAGEITRGGLAVLICRALKQEEEQTPPPAPVTPGGYQAGPDGSVTISQDAWSREDFSRQANPAVFTGVYTRELYNAIRQTLVDGNSQLPAYAMVSKENYSAAVTNVLGRMDGVVWYDHYVPENLANYWQYLDYFAVSAAMPDNYQAPFDFIQPVVQATAGMTDREKVEYLNDYLCTLLSYKEGAHPGTAAIFSLHSEELEANCGAYAVAFKFLCGAADIPCLTISNHNHTWNLVYVEGKWLYVDVSANDLYRQRYMLLSETMRDRVDRAPEQTAFLKELLVPGSTK